MVTVGDPQPFGSVPEGYRSGRNRARRLIVLLTLGLASELAIFISTGYEIGLLTRARDGGFVSLAAANASDRRHLVLGVAAIVLYAAAGLAWLIWQHRAHSNLRALHVSGLKFTPGWAVGWWFVPLGNLFLPYQTVKELWQASRPGASAQHTDWKESAGWPLLGWWWAAWISSLILTRVYLSWSDETIDDIITAGYVYLLDTVVATTASVLAILVVRGIDSRQTVAASTVVPRPDLTAADSVVAGQGVETAAPSRALRPVVVGAVIIGVTIVSFGAAYVIGRGGAATNLSFRDDFSDSGGWLVETSADGSTEYVGDMYQISVQNPAGMSSFLYPLQSANRLEAVRVEVEAQPAGTFGVLGVSCITDQESQASYDFLVATDLSRYAIFKTENATSGRVLVEGSEPLPNASVGAIRVRGDCVAGGTAGPTTLVMSVNGKKVLQHRDPEGYREF